MKFLLIGTLLFVFSACAPMGSGVPDGGGPEGADPEFGGTEFENPEVGGTEFENPEGGGTPPGQSGGPGGPGGAPPDDDEDDQGDVGDNSPKSRLIIGHLSDEEDGVDSSGASAFVIGNPAATCPADTVVISNAKLQDRIVKVGVECRFQLSVPTGRRYKMMFLKDGETVAEFVNPFWVNPAADPIDLGAVRFNDGQAFHTIVLQKKDLSE